MTPVTPFVKTMALLLLRSHLHGENYGPQYEWTDRGHTITAKKTTKSMNSRQKAQEDVKGKSPLFIL